MNEVLQVWNDMSQFWVNYTFKLMCRFRCFVHKGQIDVNKWSDL